MIVSCFICAKLEGNSEMNLKNVGISEKKSVFTHLFCENSHYSI